MCEILTKNWMNMYDAHGGTLYSTVIHTPVKTLWQGSFHFLLQNEGIGLVRSKTSSKFAENELRLWSALSVGENLRFQKWAFSACFQAENDPFINSGTLLLDFLSSREFVMWSEKSRTFDLRQKARKEWRICRSHLNSGQQQFQSSRSNPADKKYC